MRELHIIGAGGHAAVVAEIVEALSWPIAGFYDDNPAMHTQHVLGYPVLGPLTAVPPHACVALAIGSNPVREHLLHRAGECGWELPVLIHPSAVVSPSAVLGAGTVVMAQAVVNARTQVGRAVILNTACSVDHDCVIGDAVHLAPGVRLAGQVHIGAETLMGIGACVKPGIMIGHDCTIGAGSVVVSNIVDNAVVFGNPARLRR
jgi:sugar O-acyltransferase (sialic acid O-acetyltransferase NeuD family)